MCPAVAELVPPILSDDFGLVDFIDWPEFAVAVIVEEDGLEDVVFKGDFGGELGLVVGGVEAHFEFGAVGWVGFDVVHGTEVLFGVVDAGRVVAAGEVGNGSAVFEVLVVAFHEVGVGVRDGDVVGPFGGAEDVAFAEGGVFTEEAFGGVSENAEDEFVVVFGPSGGV